MIAVPYCCVKADRRSPTSRDALVHRVYGEFQEMPCLRLTHGQAQRLFGLRPDVCKRVFADLVHNGLLTVGSDDRYRLNDGATWPGPTRFTAGPDARSKAS